MQFLFRRISVFIAATALGLLAAGTVEEIAAAPPTVPTARAGVLDLRAYRFSHGPINLDGDWQLWHGRLLDPTRGRDPGKSRTVRVPGQWTAARPGNSLSPYGCATYRLKVRLGKNVSPLALHMPDAGTAYRLFVNGRLVASNGRVACSRTDFRAQYLPLITAPTFRPGNNSIVVHVANFAHHKAGLWTSLRLGYAAQLFAARERAVWTDIFLTGSFLIMALYHLGLFILRRKDVSSLHFAILCTLIVLRMLVTGERIAFGMWPDFPFELGQKIEYLSIYLLPLSFTLFFHSLFPQEIPRWVAYGAMLAVGLLSACVVVTPLAIYSRTLLAYFGISVVLLVYGTLAIGFALWRGREGALAAIIGFALFAGAAINDMLYTENVISTVLLLPAGLFAFVFSQSFMLSLRFSSAFRSIERLSGSLQETADNLSDTNRAYSRFVPTEFLSLLEKRNIREIELGDQAQRDMTVLFSDISDFTELSEQMTPKENFDFLNSYLKRMHPPIANNQGFIDKYIGDSVMALFPGAADDGLRAAAEMQQEIRQYNHHRMKQNYLPIGVRIGLHTGSLMLGTIGSESRMEGTVISDSVNVASRVEGLNKRFGTNTLFSQQTLAALTRREDFEFRRLGRVRVKGKAQSVTVYELFSGLSEVMVEMMLESRAAFESGLDALERKEYAAAQDAFHQVLKRNPGDRAAQIYLERTDSKAGAA